MHLSRLIPSVILLAALCALPACTTSRKIASRTLDILLFRSSHKTDTANALPSLRAKGLLMKLQLSPQRVRLADQRQLEIQITLENISRKYVQLQFPTTQRIEIILENARGELVTLWSEDRAFEPTVTYVGINPGEQVTYPTTLSTRDMKPGQRYKLSAYFPSFPELKLTQEIVPEE